MRSRSAQDDKTRMTNQAGRATIDQLIISTPYEETAEHWKYDRETRRFHASHLASIWQGLAAKPKATSPAGTRSSSPNSAHSRLGRTSRCGLTGREADGRGAEGAYLAISATLWTAAFPIVLLAC